MYLQQPSTFGSLLHWGKLEMNDAQTAGWFYAFSASVFTGKVRYKRDGNAVSAGKIETEQIGVV